MSSTTIARFIPNEKRDILRDAIICQALELRPLNEPNVIIQVDLVHCFIGLHGDATLLKYRISLEIGRIKNRTRGTWVTSLT